MIVSRSGASRFLLCLLLLPFGFQNPNSMTPDERATMEAQNTALRTGRTDAFRVSTVIDVEAEKVANGVAILGAIQPVGTDSSRIREVRKNAHREIREIMEKEIPP